MIRIGCSKSGDSCLNGTGTEGEKDPVDRKDHLVDPEIFCANGAGEKDPVKKAQDPGKKSCGCEENGSGDEKTIFAGRRHGMPPEWRKISFIYMKDTVGKIPFAGNKKSWIYQNIANYYVFMKKHVKSG